MICLRVIQGLTQGFIHPCAHNLLSKWAPLHERGRLAAYCYSGAQFGTVIILAISGVLASSSIGWPGIFYFSGGGGLLWCALYSYYGSGSPATNKLITAEERNYIMNSFERTAEGEVVSTGWMGIHRHGLTWISCFQAKTPWKALFTSLPMISLIVVHCSHQWGFYTLLTEIPTYMKNIHHVDIKSVNYYIKYHTKFKLKNVSSISEWFIICIAVCYHVDRWHHIRLAVRSLDYQKNT